MDRPPSVRRPRAWAWYIVLIILGVLMAILYFKHLRRAHLNEGVLPGGRPAAVTLGSALDETLFSLPTGI